MRGRVCKYYSSIMRSDERVEIKYYILVLLFDGLPNCILR